MIKKIVICFLIFFFLNLSQNMNNTFAQGNSEFIEIPLSRDFNLTEFAEDISEDEGVCSLDINLPEGQWNLTDIYLNFTNIKLDHEIKTVEDQPSGLEKFIYKKTPSELKKKIGIGSTIGALRPDKNIWYIYIRKENC